MKGDGVLITGNQLHRDDLENYPYGFGFGLIVGGGSILEHPGDLASR